MPEPLPVWATEVSHITATCTECDEALENGDGDALLFATVAEAVESITEYEDGHVDGDTLTCRACLARRQCANEGHQLLSAVGVVAGYRWCERCGAPLDTEPDDHDA